MDPRRPHKLSSDELAGMTGNERLYATGQLDSFYAAVSRRDLQTIRTILESVDFDEPAILGTIRNVEAHGTAHDPTLPADWE